MNFKKDELIIKNGKSYPVVGARLRVAHEENEQLQIITEVIRFEPMDQAAVKAVITTNKGEFSAYGAASASKDHRLIDSLLELSETRAIARALRFAGYGVEFTGLEEIGDDPAPVHNPKTADQAVNTDKFEPMSINQRRAIEAIAKSRHWNPVEASKRILHRDDLQSLDDVSKKEAIHVIGRFKEHMAA
jgi:hypothetical protein